MRVLCIGGTGQNGATLLTRMLGQLPGFVGIGEIGYLWDKGLIEDVECGCGRPFSECPFWADVGQVAFGGWEKVDAQHAVRLRTAVERQRRHLSLPRTFPLMLARRLSSNYQAAVDAYAALTRRVYEGVQQVSGAEVIVDSTKLPTHIYAVRRIKEAHLRVVHLVRDSRGVVYSNSKRVPRQGGPPGALRRRSLPLNTAARWMWINLFFHFLARVGTPTMLLRYEDLIASPKTHLAGVGQLVGVPLAPQDFEFLSDHTAHLPAEHLVAGNRVRFEAGPATLRVDDEWPAKALPPRQAACLGYHVASHAALRPQAANGDCENLRSSWRSRVTPSRHRENLSYQTRPAPLRTPPVTAAIRKPTSGSDLNCSADVGSSVPARHLLGGREGRRTPLCCSTAS